MQAAEKHAAHRRQLAAEEAAREKDRAAQKAAKIRAKYLALLVGQEPKLWKEAVAHGTSRAPSKYAAAVQRLLDLRDLAVRQNTLAQFEPRLAEFRADHASKRSLITSLDQAGLHAPEVGG